MIVFDLRCVQGHGFEGWFGSSGDFESQKAGGLLACPSCGSAEVERVPSASRINLGASPPPQPPAEKKPESEKKPDTEGRDPFAVAQLLYSGMLDELLTKSEDVGAGFPAEARRIFYGEARARMIRGEATREEHEALVEEGIPVARFPVPPRGRMS
jgi:hypothetical protein